MANVSKNGITTGEETCTQVMSMDLFVDSMMVTQNNNGYLFTYASHSFTRDSRMDRSGISGSASAAGDRVRNSNVRIHRNVIMSEQKVLHSKTLP